MTTFYRCPTCGTFWSNEAMPADPRQRHNGGANQCGDCRASQRAHDQARDDARDDAYYG